jgi:hypothetical protein
MTVEYILLLVAIFGIALKFFVSAPRDAFREAGPRLAARVEKNLATGTGFMKTSKGTFQWEPENPK